MAHEIKSTPILNQEQAERFAAQLREREMGDNTARIQAAKLRLERSLEFFTRKSSGRTGITIR